MVDRVCRACEVTLADVRFTCDLFPLEMSVFDVILGMNWLSSVEAKIDCFRRRVVFRTPEGSWSTFIGERTDVACRLGPFRRAGEDLTCQLARLALVEGKEKGKGVLPLVVADFEDVFPEDLVNLPPQRSVEFTIELQPGTGPIWTVAYRMI